MTARDGQFWPNEHDLNKFGRGQLDDAIYQYLEGSRPCFFLQEYFFMFSLKDYVKHVNRGPLLAPGA